MTTTDVMALLRANRDERGVKHWEKLGAGTGGLKSFGIGLTRLRELAGEVGRDHTLAQELWQTENHDARIIALLIDYPKQLTRDQVEHQVDAVGAGMLAHVFSSCDAPLAKAPFAFDLASAWIRSSDPLRRRCGFGLVYELSKNQRLKTLTDEFFLECIDRIRERFPQEEVAGRMAMGGALMGIGKRNKRLNQAAVKLAVAIGPIDFSAGDASCAPFDVAKHLTTDRLKRKLGV